MNLTIRNSQTNINWEELAELIRIAPLRARNADDLKSSFTNSMYKCFAFDNDKLVGVGRALADGRDCSLICDIAIRPDYQGKGIGKQVVQNLITLCKGHNKIILYSNPGKEGFYEKLGFRKMNTAMAIFQNEEAMLEKGIIS